MGGVEGITRKVIFLFASCLGPNFVQSVFSCPFDFVSTVAKSLTTLSNVVSTIILCVVRTKVN